MYKKAEYIESTGTQYIDTGVIGESGLTFEMGLQFLGNVSSDVYVMGSRTSSQRIYALHVYSSKFCIGHGSLATSSRVSDNLYHDFKTVLNQGEQGLWVDGVRYYTGTSGTSIKTNFPIYLFACNNAGNASCSKQRIYYVRIYKDNILVRNFVPVVDTDTGKAGLYDNVNDTFYTSNGENFNYHIKYTYLYLVRDRNTIYTVEDGVLVDLETNEITAELFQTHGMEEPQIYEILLTLTNPKVLIWSDKEQQHITATITATPYPQTLYSPDYDMTDATIIGIEKVIAVASDDVTFSVSFDSGETWKYYTGTDWATLSEDTSGMTAEAIMAVPTDKWAEVATTGHFMIRATLPGVESTLESFVVDYINK